MEIVAIAHTPDRWRQAWSPSGDVHRLELIVDAVNVITHGTSITITETAGQAIQLTVIGADGGPIVDLTIRRGPSGATNE